MKLSLLLALGAALPSFVVPVNAARAAEIHRSSSVFIEADEGSKQVTPLKKGDSAQVTGPAVNREGRIWLPVSTANGEGWIPADALKLTEGDVGFATPPTPAEAQAAAKARPLRVRVWGGAGPSLEITSPLTTSSGSFASNSYPGATLGFGAEAYLGKERYWILGGRFLLPLFDDKSLGFGAGRIQRFTWYGSFGYAALPNKLDLLAHLGFGLVYGESSDFFEKLTFASGVSAEYHLAPFERGNLSQGLELGAYFTNAATGAGGDVLGIAEGICSAFSGSTPDATCTPGAVPASYVFTLLYKVGWVH